MKDDLIQTLLIRINALISTANNSNKNSMKKFTSEVLAHLESMYKLLHYQKSQYDVLIQTIHGFLGKDVITPEDLENYLKEEVKWLIEIEAKLKRMGDTKTIIEIKGLLIPPIEEQKKDPKGFLEMRRDIISGLIKSIFEKLLVVKEKSCDEEVAKAREDCEKEIIRLRTENERLRLELENCYGNALRSLRECTVGATGPQGIPGERGATGPAGADGIGIIGPTGLRGEDGNDGVTGATGATGPQGEHGNDGATGPQGERGNDGAT